MYRHAVLSCGEIVRAPQTKMPSPGNERIMLMPFSFSGPCSPSFKVAFSDSADFTGSFAGASYTPNVLSLLAYTPAICPEGGTNICPLPKGLEIPIQGKYRAP